MMNLATFIDTTGVSATGVGTQLPLGVGQAEATVPDMAAWELYFRGVRNQTVTSWNKAREAYMTLKRVREQLGLPFIAPATEAGRAMTATGALSQAENDEFVNAAVTAKFLTDIADEVIAGKRRLVMMADGTMGVEMLDTDTMRIEVTGGGRPTLFSVPPTGDKMAGQPLDVTTPSGMVEGVVGVGAWPPLLIGAVVIVAALTTYFISDSYYGMNETLAEQKTLQTVSETQRVAIEKGATPEEASKMSKAIFDGATALETAKGETKEKEGETGIQSTVRTVMWIGLGITALFFLSRFIPPAAPRRPMLEEAA